jgi:hypothetical protein
MTGDTAPAKAHDVRFGGCGSAIQQRARGGTTDECPDRPKTTSAAGRTKGTPMPMSKSRSSARPATFNTACLLAVLTGAAFVM